MVIGLACWPDFPTCRCACAGWAGPPASDAGSLRVLQDWGPARRHPAGGGLLACGDRWSRPGGHGGHVASAGSHSSLPATAPATTCRPWSTVHPPTRPVLQAAGRDQQGHDPFYARLYVGLWHEAHGNAAEAEAAITQVSTGCACTAQQPQGGLPCSLITSQANPAVPAAGVPHPVRAAIRRLYGGAGAGALPAPRLASVMEGCPLAMMRVRPLV